MSWPVSRINRITKRTAPLNMVPRSLRWGISIPRCSVRVNPKARGIECQLQARRPAVCLTFKMTGHIVSYMARPNVRQKIVDAGLKVLIEKGFNGCGVQDITAAAGVPKGSFYNHFESKEALGAEVVERYGRDNPRRAVLADASVPALQRLRAHFERLNETYAGARFGRGCLLGNFSAELADQSQLIRERLADLYIAWSTDLA